MSEIESIIRDYIKDNLMISIQNRWEYDGQIIQVKLFLVDGTEISQGSYHISKVC